MAEVIVQQEALTTSSTPDYTNKGKHVHDISPRQLRGKLSQCKSFIQQALWFCESFGLCPEFIQLRKQHTGSPVKLTLNSPHNSTTSPQPSNSDYESVHHALYILDRFAVSDESYHELSMASTLPPLYKIKKARLILNSSLDIRRLQGPSYPGAFRPIKRAIEDESCRMVSDFVYTGS